MSISRSTMWSQDRVAQGLCGCCGKPVRTYKSLCDGCMGKQRKRMRERRNSLHVHTRIALDPPPNPAKVKRSQRPITHILVTLLPARFITKLVFKSDDSCWHWVGSQNRNPRYPWQRYGVYDWSEEGVRRSMAAHRFAYTAIRGPVPRELDIDHLCENKLCVNPDHLEPVTRQENMIRTFVRRELYA